MAWREATAEEVALIQGGAQAAPEPDAGKWREATPEELALISGGSYVQPGDVEARKKQVAAQAAAEPKNVARERLGIGSELVGGVKDVGSALLDVASADAYRGALDNPLTRTALGAVRTVASPLAPLTNLSTEAGEATSRFLQNLGLTTGADVGAGLVQTLLDVAGPSAVSRAAKAVKPAAARLVSPRQQAAAKQAELTSSTAASEAEIARLKAAREAVPEATAERVATREASRDAAIESVESIAEAGRKEVPTAAAIRERFAKDAPLGEDVGKTFKGRYQDTLNATKARLNTMYDDALEGTGDVQKQANGYIAAIDDVLGEKGVSRPLPTQAERIAQKAKNAVDVSEDAADQIAALEEATRTAPSAAHKLMAEDALAEFVKANPLPDSPTIRDLVIERQRINAALRVARNAKNDNLTRQLNKLKSGIEADIGDDVLDAVAVADKAYLTDFVPYFGKRSVTRAINEGAPEKVVSSIIRPASDKKAVETVSRAWELMDEPARVNTRKAFVNKGVEDAFRDGAFDSKKFTEWWRKHSDPTGTGNKVLRTVFGNDFKDMQSVVNQLQSANHLSLDDVAAQLTKGFKKGAAGDIKQLVTQGTRQEKALGEGIRTAETAQKLMKQRLQKEIDALVGPKQGMRVAQRLESIGSGILAGGTVASLIGSPSGWGRILSGGILILSSKGLSTLLQSTRGRAPLKAVLRATPGTSQAAAAARQVQNFFDKLETED